MIKKILSLAFVAFLLFSCKESNAEALETEATATPTEVVQPEATQPEQAIQNTETPSQVQVQEQPAAVTPNNSGPFIQQQNSQSSQTAPGFSGKPNPAHGQPGHRCDLQVGAILP